MVNGEILSLNFSGPIQFEIFCFKKSNAKILPPVVKGENPSVNVVLMEDSAAVMGVAVALGCICLTSFLNRYDKRRNYE